MKVGLVHTSATLVPVFAGLAQTHIPGHATINLVDDSLIKDVIRDGRLTPQVARRVVDLIGLAADAGADHILVTCSSIGAAVEMAAGLTPVPVLRVDQPMADEAVRTGKRIGVIATLATTLEPTADLVRRRAEIAGSRVEVVSKVCEGAFDALMSGDGKTHDDRVASALREMSEQVDIILLAQASMGRVVDNLPEADKRIPILASPPLAMAHLGRILNQSAS
jgi:Asp/Glu/hydantoin racemase